MDVVAQRKVVQLVSAHPACTCHPERRVKWQATWRQIDAVVGAIVVSWKGLAYVVRRQAIVMDATWDCTDYPPP